MPVAVPVAKGRKSHPKTETVTRTVKTLLNRLPHDRPLEASCGVSIRGFHFVRITGESRGVTWRVDIYRCRMFVVSASNRNGFKTSTLTSVLTYLQAAMA
jgi:hypothetical protein